MKTKGKNSNKKTGRKIKAEGESSRNDILEAFLKVSYELGPDQITLKTLAEASGMTLANVRYYFAAKNIKLYHAALQFLLEHAYKLIEDQIGNERLSPGFNPIKAYIHAMFFWIEQNPIYSSFVVYFYYLCTTKVEVPMSNDVFLKVARARIEGLINEGLGKKIYRLDCAVEEAVKQVHATVMGTCIIAATQNGHPHIISEQKTICEFLVLDRLLHSTEK